MFTFGKTSESKLPASSRRLIVPRIRLETFDAGATRCVLYVTYIVLAISIALTVVVRLGVDRSGVQLADNDCNNSTLPHNSGCTLPWDAYGVNGTLWSGIVTGLSQFDGKIQVVCNPQTLDEDPQIALPFVYDVVLDAYTDHTPSVADLEGNYIDAFSSAAWSAGQNGAATRQLASGGFMTWRPPLQSLWSRALGDSTWLRSGVPGWQVIATVANATATLDCYTPVSSESRDGELGATPQPVCNQILLFDTDWITYGQGGGGGFSTYRVTIYYHDFNLTQGTDVLVSYEVTYQTAAFRVSDVATRIFFMCSTLVIGYLWLRRMCHQRVMKKASAPADAENILVGPESAPGYEVVRHHVPIYKWLPQQRWTLYLMVTTLLWQNPLYVAMQFMASGQVPFQLALLSAIVEFGGWASLFTYWWCLVDGMKVPLDVLQQLDKLTSAPTASAIRRYSDTTSISSDAARMRTESNSSQPESGLPVGTTTSGNSVIAGGYVVPTKLKTRRPSRHPLFNTEVTVAAPPQTGWRARCRSCCCWRSCFGVDVFKNPLSPFHGVKAYPTTGFMFYYPKILFFVVLCAVGTGLQLLAQPDLVFGGRGNSTNPLSDPKTSKRLLQAVVGLGSLYLILVTVWLAFFIWANVTTGKQLERLPYAMTRYQQLSYRFFIFQQFVVVLFVVAVNLVPLGLFLKQYFSQPLVSPGGGNASLSIENQVASMIKSFTQAVTPIGELVIVSVYVYMLAYCYGPPSTPHPPGFIGETAERPSSRDMRSAVPLQAGDRSSIAFAGAALKSVITFAPRTASVIGNQLRTTVETNVLGLPDSQHHKFSLHTCCWLFDLSLAVYFDAHGMPTPCSYGPIPAAPHGFEILDPIYDPATDTYVWVVVREDRIVVTFRGTCSQQNFNTDVALALTEARFDDEESLASQIPGIRQTVPRIHTGFWRAYSSIRDRLKRSLATALERTAGKARVYMTGHSLGGALAILAAYDLHPTIKEFPELYAKLGGGTSFLGGRTSDSGQPSRARSIQPMSRTISARTQEGKIVTFRPADFGPDEALDDVDRIAQPRSYKLAKRPSSTVLSRPIPAFQKAASTLGGPTNLRVHSAKAEARLREPLISPIAAETATEEDESTAIAHMLLDDDVLEGADPLDCVGIPPDEDPEADSEFAQDIDASLLRRRSWRQQHRLPEGTEVVVYTFGSPRVGNPVFAGWYNKRIPYTFRVVFDGDVVSGVPKWFWDYKHCGMEVWLDAFGNHIVNPSFVEKTFRARARTRLASHRMASYRRGLIYARRNEGLPQFRNWIADKEIIQEHISPAPDAP